MTNQELINTLTAQNNPDGDVLIHDQTNAEYWEVGEVSTDENNNVLLSLGDENWPDENEDEDDETDELDSSQDAGEL